MSKENLRISGQIGCLDATRLRATLVSTHGSHCDVWRASRMVVHDGHHDYCDVVIKRHLRGCSFAELRIWRRDYLELRFRLGAMVPEATFIATEIDGHHDAVVIAEAVRPWFDMANSANEEVAVPLLRQHARARWQLRQFLGAAELWQAGADERLIDLYGLDNLVLDVNRNLRYIDSFNVFFYPDLLHLGEEADEVLRGRMEVALQRLDYLRHVAREARRGGGQR